MIKAVFLDLDDTLITTQTEHFTGQYLGRLASFAAPQLESHHFIKQIMASVDEVLSAYDPTRSLYERFVNEISHRLSLDIDDLDSRFRRFFQDVYPSLCDAIEPRSQSAFLISQLLSDGYQLVLATNPILPEAAIHHRMLAGGIDPGSAPFVLITTMERMHFAKPYPEYYEEILALLDIYPEQALVVGNDLERDILPATTIGMHTYWIVETMHKWSDIRYVNKVDASGTFEDFVACVHGGWLKSLTKKAPHPKSLIHRAAALPSLIGPYVATFPTSVLDQRPAADEWSVKEIICHLGDYELAQNRLRLGRILREDNPFLSGKYDPWTEVDRDKSGSADRALSAFVERRHATVNWLAGVPDASWHRPARSPVFGPTTFGEMVRFVTEHDRTHIRQVRDTVRRITNRDPLPAEVYPLRAE